MKNLSKLLAVATLATGLNLATVSNANAGFVIGLAANPAVGTIIAWSGWGYGVFSNAKNHKGIGAFIFLLDEKSNQVEFSPVDPKAAAEMGISESEQKSYNDEIDRVNAAVDEMNSDLQNAPKNDLEEIENKSMAKLQDSISPATFSAMQKIIKASI